MDRNEWLDTLPKNLVWAELGVFIGDFSKEIFKRAKPKKLHLIDTFPDYENSGDKDGKNIISRNLTSIPDQLNKYFNSDIVKIHKKTTHEFLSNFIEEIECVYIDANHSFENVSLDLSLSYNILSNGGIISGHDYHHKLYPGVYDAVNFFCKEKKLTIDFISSDDLPTYMIKVIK